MRPKLPDQQVRIAFNYGGLGDDICRLPALKFMLKDNPHAKVTLACPDYLIPVIEHFFLPGELERVVGMTEMWASPLLRKLPWIQTKTEYFTPQKTHLVDHAFSYICDRIDIPITEKNYLQFRLGEIDASTFTLPVPYCVLTPGHTADVRRLPAATFNGIASWLTLKGITPVYLGSRKTVRGGIAESIEGRFDEEVDYSKGIDLRDQTSILEAAKVMAGASCVVGLDNGLLHVAGGTSAPIVCAFTNALPSHRLPIRNSILGHNCWPVTPPGCFACQSTVGFLPEHDFRNCVFPSLKCNEKLTADLFIEKLKEIL